MKSPRFLRMSHGMSLSRPFPFFLFAAALALATSYAPAASAEDATDAVYSLPEMEVLGGEVAEAAFTARAARRAAPNAKSIIEGEQLHQFNDLGAGDAIRRLPGVTYPGINKSRSIQLRGINKAYTQVLIDGHTLLDEDASRNLEVDRVPVSMIERVEIIRSPLASLPSNGAAGTVNIITKRDFQRPTGPKRGISIDGGHLSSNGEHLGAAAWASGEQGRLGYSLAAEHRRRLLTEDSVELAYSGAAATPNGGEVRNQFRKYDETFLAARLDYQVSDRDQLSLVPTFAHSKETRDQQRYRYVSNQSRFNRLDDEQRIRKRQTTRAQTAWTHEFASGLKSRVTLEGQTGYERTRRDELRTSLNASGQPTGTPTPGNRLAEVDLDRIGADVTLSQSLGQHDWQGGLGTALDTRDEVESRNGIVSAQRDYEVEEQISHAYLSDSFPLLGPDRLTLGVRVEHSATKTIDDQKAQFRRRATDVNPSAHYRYTTAGEGIDLRVGLARTLRRPNLRDLTPTLAAASGTLSRPDTRGNPQTRPEKIWGIDAGADWYLPNDLGLVAVNLYARDFADKIESTLALEGTRWVRSPRNAGDGTLYGAEIEARVSLGNAGLPGLTVFGNATTMKSELKDPLTGAKRRFEETPSLVSNVGLDYYLAALRTTFGVNLNTTYSYSQDIAQPTNSLGVVQRQHTDFSTLHLLGASVKLRITAQWSVALSANNILRPKDKRTLDTYDASGTLLSTTRSREASYSTYYLRTSYTW